MATSKFRPDAPTAQAPGYTHFAEIIDAIDATRLLRKLNEYRQGGGRRTYQIVSFWRAYLVSFLLNMTCTNDIIRRLKDDPALMLLCGFSTMPHRTTFGTVLQSTWASTTT